MNLEACQPMSPGARLIHKIRHEDSNIGGDGGDNEGGGTQMYRLMATRGTRDVGRCGVSCLGGGHATVIYSELKMDLTFFLLVLSSSRICLSNGSTKN